MATKSALVVAIALSAGIACTRAHASGCYQYKPVRGHADFGVAFETCLRQTNSGPPTLIADALNRGKLMDACMRGQGWRSVRISAVDCPAPIE